MLSSFHQGKHWKHVHKKIKTTNINENISSENEKYQMNLFIPIASYDSYIESIESLLRRALNDEVIFAYKIIDGNKIYNSETMRASLQRSYLRNDPLRFIEEKLTSYNNPVVFYPANVATSELAELCLALEDVLTNIQVENQFLNMADLYLTNHISFRCINLSEKYINIFKLSSEQLETLKKLAINSYLFITLEDYIYGNKLIQKYLNQLVNVTENITQQDKIHILDLKKQLEQIENDMMGFQEEDLIGLTEEDIKKQLEELRLIASEQKVVEFYWQMREGTFFKNSNGADALATIINSPEKMDLPQKYGENYRVSYHIASQIMPVICKRSNEDGKVVFNLRAIQNEKFLQESMSIIVEKIDKTDFEGKFEVSSNSLANTISCFNYYFSDPKAPHQKVNWLKNYSFYEDDTLNEHSKIDRFRMQIILKDLIDRDILSRQNAGWLLNDSEMLENQKHYPFTYAYQQLKLRLSRIETHRPQLKSLLVFMETCYKKLIHENDKYEQLKSKVYQTHLEVQNQAREDIRFFKCFVQSNLADALKDFEDEIIRHIDLIMNKKCQENHTQLHLDMDCHLRKSFGHTFVST